MAVLYKYRLNIFPSTLAPRESNCSPPVNTPEAWENSPLHFILLHTLILALIHVCTQTLLRKHTFYANAVYSSPLFVFKKSHWSCRGKTLDSLSESAFLFSLILQLPERPVHLKKLQVQSQVLDYYHMSVKPDSKSKSAPAVPSNFLSQNWTSEWLCNIVPSPPTLHGTFSQ